MKQFHLLPAAFILAGLLLFLSTPTQSQETPKGSMIWEIGRCDRSGHEFNLAPDGYRRFNKEGLFLVGRSDPANDWPYVHPGPNDSWAGSRSHSFRIFFGLVKPVNPDSLRLRIDITDSHGSIPPTLDVMVNGSPFTMKLPAGGGDASVNGDLSKGKPYRIELPFHPGLLQEGINQISISTRSGSWFLYDAVSLFGPEGYKQAPVGDFVLISGANAVRALRQSGDHLVQDLMVSVFNAGGTFRGEILIDGQEAISTEFITGDQAITLEYPAVEEEKSISVTISRNGQKVATHQLIVKPVRKMTVYILPHSHTDIGYTEIQTAIEDKQVENLIQGMEYARQTADYPDGARFVWNVEVGWAADLYLQRLGEEARTLFLDAVNQGQVGLNGMYLNVLTGLCRPEELIRLFRFSEQMEQLTGQTVDAAMISDVPGYTWGTVTAMAQAGIRYFSVAPNFFDRIGDILVEWENRPFYWVSPSGHEKVLVWIPLKGYAMSHIVKALSPTWVGDYANQMEAMGYPYDIAHIRWSGHGDNASPDTSICGFVRDWNNRYTWPRFVISTTSEAFRAFEGLYGEQLPSVRGDWTPYWEDGAGSSALETALNRNSADRLTQAQMLWAISDPASFPANEFDEAWNKVLLYSEHTWGAWCSITDPENPMTMEQWAIKKAYADDAAARADELLAKALGLGRQNSQMEYDVINTANWQRGGIVLVDAKVPLPGDRVLDPSGRALRSQRLSDGQLAFECPDIEPFGQLKIRLSEGPALTDGSVSVTQHTIRNNLIECEVDPTSGDVIRITDRATGRNLVDISDGQALNRYLFFEGSDNKNLKTSEKAEILVVEPGPLVGVLEITSSAPGCRQLTRQIWLTHNADHLILVNTVDKERAPMPERTGDWFLAQNRNKESLNFAFPFNVPDGIMHLDLPLGMMIPWIDQIPSACKNWFTIGRWADVSNESGGITWASLDAPLLQVGELSANLVGSQSNPDVWRKKVDPTQRLFSWVMNNHWGTNYRQYQEGPVTFRYVLQPHRGFDPLAATRMASGFSQPLLIRPAAATHLKAPIQIDGDEVFMISFKPSDKGKGFHFTLYNPGLQTALFSVHPLSGRLWLSDSGERRLAPAPVRLELDPMEAVTLLIE